MALKGLAGWYGASLALFANSLHSAVRLMASRMGPSKSPGGRKAEIIVHGIVMFHLALFTALILTASVRRLFFSGGGSLRAPSLWALGVAALAACCDLVLAWRLRCPAEKLRSAELKGLSAMNLSSAYLSLGVTAALAISQLRLPEADALGAIFVGLLIGKSCLDSMRSPLERLWSWIKTRRESAAPSERRGAKAHA